MEKRFCNQQLTLCKFLEVDFPETFWPNSFSSACWCQRGLVAGACRSALGPSCIPDAATKHSRTHSPNGGCKRPGVGLKLMLQTVQFSDDCCTATVNQIPRQTSSQNPFDKAYMHIYIYIQLPLTGLIPARTSDIPVRKNSCSLTLRPCGHLIERICLACDPQVLARRCYDIHEICVSMLFGCETSLHSVC